MFKEMPQSIEVTQGHLRALEGWRRAAGAQSARQLRPITPETGRFLAILLSECPPGDAFEAGTGGGYSALWLALACRAATPQRRLFTFETDANKFELARQSLSAAKVGDVVEARRGDALAGMAGCSGLCFCFFDAGPEVARAGLEAALSALPCGGIICVSGVVDGAADFETVLAVAESDERADSVVLPLGAGLLLCRKK